MFDSAFMLGAGHELARRQLPVEVIRDELRSLRDKATAQAAETAKDQKLIDYQVQQLDRLLDYGWDTEFPHGISEFAKYSNRIGGPLTALLLATVPYDKGMYDEALMGSDRDLARLVESIKHRGIAQIFADNPDLSKADKKAIKKLLSTQAFKPLFDKSKSEETVGVEFVPARGLLSDYWIGLTTHHD